MHCWGDEDVDWEGINDAAEYIGTNLIRWGRIPVTCIKEKFGRVCVYCGFGWYNFYTVYRPHYCYHKYRYDILSKIDYSKPVTKLFKLLNFVVVPIQKKVYRYFYKKALKKWPHLWKEIIGGADCSHLLGGLSPEWDELVRKYKESSDG